MPTVHQNTIVPYTPSQMYQLVDEVERYAEFLPWCKESTLLSRTDDEVRASLTLSGGGFQKSFSTCNRLQKDKMIEIRLLDGPFHHLEGFWQFEEAKDNAGCQIILNLEFEFSNKLIGLAFGPVFHQVATTLVGAFHKRAEQIYGANN